MARHLELGLIVVLCAPAVASTAACSKKDGYYVYEDGAPERSGRKGGESKMFGRVVDRNDKPLSRVSITIDPGEVERISNRWGEYEIEYLFGEGGERVGLEKNEDYAISAFKPGYQETTQRIRYTGGTIELPTITLVEDNIRMSDDDEENLIPDTLGPGNDSGADGVGQSYSGS